MQSFLKVSLAAAVLLGSSSAAVAAPSSQMLALGEPAPKVKRTALPYCSRRVVANCMTRGSQAVEGGLSTPLIVGGTVVVVGTTLGIALSGGKNSASP